MSASSVRTALALAMVLVLVASIVPIGAAGQEGEQESDGGERTIDSCTAITEPGVYQLGDNLTDATANTTLFEADGVRVDACIVVASDDVVIDGNGNAVEGSGAVAADETNVSIANQTTDTDLPTQAAESSAADEPAATDTVGENETDSVGENETDSVGENETDSVGENEVLTVGVAVLPQDGARANLTNVTVRDISTSNWFAGMFVENVTDSAVRDVDASGNGELGVEFANVSDTSVSDLRATDNGGVGVIAAGSHDNYLDTVHTEDNTYAGTLLVDSHHNDLVNATAANQGIAGVALVNASENALIDVTVRNTTGEFAPASGGLVFENASGNLVAEVTATDNRNWTYYSTNGSTGNFVKNVTADGRSLSFTATDVALRFDGNGTEAAGTPLVVLDTTENASIVLVTTWSATGASVDVAPTNETVSEAGDEATNATVDNESTNATATES